MLLPHEVDRYLENHPISIRELDSLVNAATDNRMGLPILIRQYAKLGAEFLSAATDHNFSFAAGIFLKVDMRTAPRNALRLYLGKDYVRYLERHSR